ncbi:Mitochondrial Carrier (MC) Family [Phytophthora nicotianae]|uniref:Mitochondrial Carrier (MC) Family n=1 Tax=Phytophthora nicotianae TaxID=4792 RepID=A0A0W8DDL3_PHYNI|nr:Mitochondrial Carrier (MC) Family [Phytophthora nicotianae]
MSKFTESEVKNMINQGGNEAAQKYWRNKHDPSFRPNGGTPKFDSFKIAPPPGSHFSAASVTSPPATNDLMGLSPPKKADDDLFGFDAPAAASGTPSNAAPAASSPFNAFDAPTPTNRAGSRANSVASLDPFSDMTAAAPSAPAPIKQNSSPFDAFSSPSAASPSSIDAFAAPSPASTTGSNVFDALGGSKDPFADFTGSTSSSRTNSANPVLDPFANQPEKPTAAAADPFAAFEGMQSSSAAPPPSSCAPTPDFSFPSGNNVNQQQAAMNDPFDFASGRVTLTADSRHSLLILRQTRDSAAFLVASRSSSRMRLEAKCNSRCSHSTKDNRHKTSNNGTASNRDFPDNSQCTRQDSTTTLDSFPLAGRWCPTCTDPSKGTDIMENDFLTLLTVLSVVLFGV